MNIVTNLNKKISAFVLLAITTTAFPMGYAKKTASCAGTIAHYTAAGWMLKKGVERLMHDEEKNIQEYSLPAPEPLADFVHGILRREKIPNPETVKVRLHKYPTSPYAAGKRVVYINIEEAQQLANCFGKQFDSSFKIKHDHNMGCSITATWKPTEYIFRTVGMLTHEAAHIRNHDTEKTTAACFAIPIVSLMLSRYTPILSLIKHSVSSKVLSGLMLNEINHIAFGAYSRRLEYQADDAITRTPEMYMFIKELNINSYAFPPNPNPYEILKNTHPDSRLRITRMVDRLQLSADQEEE
jgi:hypothetical protein